MVSIEIVVVSLVGQFDPEKSRFSFFVPGQHPCADDKQKSVTLTLVTIGVIVV